MSCSNSTKPARISVDTSEPRSNGPSPVITPPQYSWRRDGALGTYHTPPPKENPNPKYLIQRKYALLQAIALEYSQLAGLMHDELDITGIEPERYIESIRAYEKAVDDSACFQMYMDSMALTVGREAEDDIEAEGQTSHKGTYTMFSPSIFRKITYGSLQNIVRPQEKESKHTIEVSDCSNRTTTQSQGPVNSTSCEATIKIIPTAAVRPCEIRTSEMPQSMSLSTVASSKPDLRRFFSLKSLCDSLPTPSTKTPSGALWRLTGGNDKRDSCDGEQLPPPLQLQPSLSKENTTKPNDLTAWKNVEIDAASNSLRVDKAPSSDSTNFTESTRTNHGCALENKKTKHYRKKARQWTLASRSLSVGRFEPLLHALSQDAFLPPNTSHCQPSTHFSIMHADEQSSDSCASISSAKQEQRSALAISCHSFDSVRPYQNVKPSPSLSPKSSLNPTKDTFLHVHNQGPYHEVDSPKTSYVKYLFPNQSNQIPMRSYGRPNYSRHGPASSTQNGKQDSIESNRPCSNQPSTCSRHCLVRYTDSVTRSRVWARLPTCSSPTHFNKIKSVSELEQLTCPSSRRHGFPEVTPIPNVRSRFTLADKLNMCTTSYH